ncbi:hypothetical protein COCNU_scaffold006118G000010 [Cocos nucifera]|nr:hypothetical protein [Cocos nucifera]
MEGSTFTETEIAQVGGAVREDSILGVRRITVERDRASKDIAGRAVATERGGYAARKDESTVRRTSFAIGKDSMADSIFTIAGSSNMADSSSTAIAMSGNRVGSSSAAVGRTERTTGGAAGRTGSATTTREIFLYMPDDKNDQRIQ